MFTLKFCLFICLAFAELLLHCNAGENHCSKFPYEEALLEKMIRMEIKVEQMEMRILAAKEQFLEETKTLKEKKDRLDEISQGIVKDMEARENAMNQAFVELQKKTDEELADKTSRMETVFRQKEIQISRMSENLAALAYNTSHALQNIVRKPVYFMAKVTEKLAYRRGEVMLFDSILNKEEGVHYNPYTGKFTAPMAGVYLFTLQVCMPHSDGVEYSFMVDGVVALAGWSSDSSSDTCESSSFIKNLQAGSSVWIENTASNRLRNDEPFRWNVFSGSLVTALI